MSSGQPWHTFQARLLWLDTLMLYSEYIWHYCDKPHLETKQHFRLITHGMLLQHNAGNFSRGCTTFFKLPETKQTKQQEGTLTSSGCREF